MFYAVAVVKVLSDLLCSWTVLTWVLHLLPASCGSEPRLMLPTPEEKNILAMNYFLCFNKNNSEACVYVSRYYRYRCPSNKRLWSRGHVMSKADVR